jgi:hypothetical protein
LKINPVADPWSKKPIENPVRNTKCGHVYDQAIAEKMFVRTVKSLAAGSNKRPSKGPVVPELKCPMMGCTNDSFRREHLVPAPDVLAKIQHK